MTVLTNIPYNKEHIEELSKDKNEPKWMSELRLEAFDLAEKLDMPKPDKTNINRWNFTEFKHRSSGEAIDSIEQLPAELEAYFDQDNIPENLIIQRNETLAYATLSDDLKDKGVIFTDIFTAMSEHGDLVKKYFMKDGVSINEHRLTALHAALLNGGVFLYVPKNVQIEEPIQTVFWQEDEAAALFNHVLIVADDNSSITYVENYISNNDEQETVANIVAEVFANDNAKIAFGAVDNFAAGTTAFISRRGVAYENATIDWALGQMNDGNTVSRNTTHLVGDHSVSHAKTVTAGRGSNIQNFTATTLHIGKDTDGDILQRGVLREKTTAIFNAIGKIEDGATRANAVQESRVLMLSEKARGDANPILLIDEDDVTAGHAASVGQIDAMQLYYLMSRGISRERAEHLIIHGFLEPVVDLLPIETVKSQLRRVIEGKLN